MNLNPHAQELQIDALDTNPGLLPIHLGQAKLKDATHEFIHYFNLQPVNNQINTIIDHYNEIEVAIKEDLCFPYIYSLSNFKQHILFQINLAKQKFISVYPFENIKNIRPKRGLINALGSVVKFISGNLDQEDAKRYDEAIEHLQSNQDKIINSFNKQISLNIKLLDNYNETLELIQHNQDVISQRINDIQQEISKLNFEFSQYQKVRDVLDQISDNLNSLILFLTDLENAITFSKLGTLHRSILNIDEMKMIINKLQKLYRSEQLMYTKDIDLYNYYNLIDVKSYYSGYRLVFILSIPIIYPYPFNYYHLFPIPTPNLTTIIPKKPYLANYKDLYQYQDYPCQHLNPGYYCPEIQINHLDEQEDCITSILNIGNQVNCQVTHITLKSSIVEKIDAMHYLLISPHESKIQINCNKIDFINLKGTYLITLPLGCSFEFDNAKFTNEKGTTNNQPLLLPEIKIQTIKENITYEKLELKNISPDQLITLKNNQRELVINKAIPSKTDYHYWTTPIYFIIVLGILIWTFSYAKKRGLCTRKTKRAEAIEKIELEKENQHSVLFTPKTSS